ncbi:HAAS signaling domain-containing protein [Brevibacillus borstelensis]|uniref:HAAS signaling domain-containing protein n=1 Tax=Brevibacillus borstelensis TaxID=45462 RepID=UPI0030BD0C93
MTRREFMDELDGLLRDLPDKERLDILADYTEHFLIGVERGKSEQEIAESLGSPKALAREILAGYRIHQAQSNASISNMTRAVLATVSLGFFNLVFVLGPFVGLIGVLIGLFGTALALLLAPIGLLLQFGFPEDVHEQYLLLFSGLTSFGLGGMLAIGLARLSGWLYRQFLRYLHFNVRMIRGK